MKTSDVCRAAHRNMGIYASMMVEKSAVQQFAIDHLHGMAMGCAGLADRLGVFSEAELALYEDRFSVCQQLARLERWPEPSGAGLWWLAPRFTPHSFYGSVGGASHELA